MKHFYPTLNDKMAITDKIKIILTLELRRCRFRHQDFFGLLYLQIFALQGVDFFRFFLKFITTNHP